MSWFVLIIDGLLLLSGGSSGADLKIVLQQAKKGDVEAQYRLAEMYAEAQGVDQDYAKATQWARKAAEQGNAKAQYRLASIIFTGASGQREQPEALQLFLESARGLKVLAKEGDADAQSKLGILYVRGIGVQKDISKAAKLFEESSKAGCVKAQVDLGGAYLLGSGVERNPTTAGYWFQKAAKAGHGQAQIQLGLLNLQGNGCRQDIQKGLTWLEKASNHRRPDYAKQARVLLSQLKETPPDAVSDVNALEKKATGDDLNAQLELARRYERGVGVKVDFNRAANYLNAATRQGSSSAAHRLGGMLMMGRGVKKDTVVGVRYWKLAAQLGHAGAQVDYAVASAKGDGMDRNLPESYFWMLIARRQVSSEERQKSLRALQGIILNDLTPDQILEGLKRARTWKKPMNEELRNCVVGAECGEAMAQFALGKIIRDSHPIEALKWLRLAAEGDVKGAAEKVGELSLKLNKSELKRVDSMVSEFKPMRLNVW